MLPMVGTADEARHIVNSMKYHPAGKRGVALQVAHDRYRPGSVADKFAAANKRTTLFCQIETAEGVENADAIAAIDGVDCLWVGHFDLSVSLGIPGQFDHPNFKTRDRQDGRRHQEAQEGARPAGARRRDRASSSTRRASISSAIPAMSGCCTTRSPRRSRKLRDGCKPKQGERRWPTSSASRSPAISGRPTARRPIPISISRRSRAAPGVEMAFLESANPIARRAARGFRRADPACPSLRARRACRRAAGSPSSRASASATTPSMSTPAPRPASRWSSRRTACAGRSRSRSSRCMLALTGKLMIKDRLTREAAAGFAKRSDHMGVGLVGRTLRLARHRQYRRRDCSAWPSPST